MLELKNRNSLKYVVMFKTWVIKFKVEFYFMVVEDKSKLYVEKN